jgi:dGTP triphosphohydrolase
MEKDLCKFMENVEILGKEFTLYIDDEKGIEFPLNTVHLLTRVDYLELTKEEYKVAKFQQKIDDLEYEIANVKKAVPKNEITGKDEDKYTITEKEVAVRKVWNVSNTAGAFKSYTNKEEAMEKAKEINKKIFDFLK